MSSVAFIYKIEHKESGRCYIGHSLNCIARFNSHKRLLRVGKHHSPYLQNVWNKYGEDAFEFLVVETCQPDQKLFREQWWIDNCDSCFNYARVAGSRLGVPQTAEANEKVRRVHLGAKRTEEAKRKMSQAAMGNTRKLGVKLSAESCATISAALKGECQFTEAKIRHRENLHNNWARSEANIARLKANPPRSMLGRKHSPETKEKMRLARLAVIAAKGPDGMAEIGRKISSTKLRKKESA